MRAKKILFLLAVLMLSLSTVSCNSSNDEQYKKNVQKYQQELKNYQKNSITPEKREEALKKMFPNYKPKSNE